MGDETDTEFQQARRQARGLQPDLFGQPKPSNGWPGALEGMKRAADHADRDAPQWQARATAMLRRYIAAHPGTEFIAPQVRAWAEAHGLDQPPTGFAYGNVFRAASRAKLIRRVGFRIYGDDTMHTQSCAEWRST